MSRKTPAFWIFLVVASALALILLTIVNLNFTRNNPGGNDFLVHWMGTRNLITQGISPYSEETARDIQEMAYGRPARPGEHELRVAYPLYSVIVFFPFALIKDFQLARALWMTLLEIAIIGLSILSLRVTRWKPKLITLGFFLIFSVTWYHAIRPLINGNAVVLVALALVGTWLAIRAGMEELAGILLAVSTIKPQLAVVPIMFIIVWSVTQRRWRVIFWLAGSVLLLGFASALLVPDWLLQNIREVLRYPSYNPPGTIISAMAEIFPVFGRRVGIAISVCMVVLILVEWWFGRKKDLRRFSWTFCFTLVASQWLMIQTDPGNFIILLPALVFVLKNIEERWPHHGQAINSVLMLFLLVGLWILFIATLEYGEQPQQSPIMFLPIPGMLILLLYWFRWWAIRPTTLGYIEEYPDQ